MSRQQKNEIERLTRELSAVREQASEARDQSATVKGQLAGERAAAQTIAGQLAARAADVGAELGRVQDGARRARTDALTMRTLIAEYVVLLRDGMDPELAATSLLDHLMVRGIDLAGELTRAMARVAADTTAADAPDNATTVTIPAVEVAAAGQAADSASLPHA